jgi:hypothetical protein
VFPVRYEPHDSYIIQKKFHILRVNVYVSDMDVHRATTNAKCPLNLLTRKMRVKVFGHGARHCSRSCPTICRWFSALTQGFNHSGLSLWFLIKPKWPTTALICSRLKIKDLSVTVQVRVRFNTFLNMLHMRYVHLTKAKRSPVMKHKPILTEVVT